MLLINARVFTMKIDLVSAAFSYLMWASHHYFSLVSCRFIKSATSQKSLNPMIRFLPATLLLMLVMVKLSLF